MLREMEEMETAQICQALRISQNNLWVMLHRASGVYGVELVREQTLASITLLSIFLLSGSTFS